MGIKGDWKVSDPLAEGLSHEAREVSARVRSYARSRLGLQIPDSKVRDVLLRLTMAARDAGFRDAVSYAGHLFSSDGSEERDKVLASVLTVGETYFFRDRPLLEVLETTVLPEIIARRRKETDPVLRLWSAGCSTGEEPYTLAMIAHRFLASHPDWDFSVLATDVNDLALARARLGRYRPWSFRSPVPAPYEKYLRRENGRRRIGPELRRKVVFRRLNLAQDDYPSPETQNMDLIFCRNVLMYFDPAVRTAVLDRLHRCLADGGYLVTAAAELTYVDKTCWERIQFPRAVLFRKKWEKDPATASGSSLGARASGLLSRTPLSSNEVRVPWVLKWKESSPGKATDQPEKRPWNLSVRSLGTNAKRHEPASHAPAGCPKTPGIPVSRSPMEPAGGFPGDQGNGEEPVSERPRESLSEEDLQAVMSRGELDMALERVSSALEDGRIPDEVLRRMVRTLVQGLSNAGRRDDALALLARVGEQRKLDPAYPMLKASICCEAGDREGAITAYRQALYLDASLVPALLGLGTLYQTAGNVEKARRCWVKALKILEARDPEEEVPDGEGLSVAQARALFQRLLEGGETARPGARLPR
ncbi:CheR methyltransferase, SAM binding domain [Desulfacinum hydrothermale DSM 13146]|uniref:CheR methyltransferase, SAM binding domain n=1 Tax=Desulfacinum hydrothermale DSM 13146 TaxID=1121390 RepID=A0A1W1XAJ2_9BACT|nr:CheR family methyltransferase [Desulfacinum hydrothermale]SMC20804.1 CheR methyltransferase, SAM binding domain [Desulfacinum hydrothermale DSM 13146]